MKAKLHWLPNLITMGNLFCGFLAILFGTRVHENSQYPGQHNYHYYILAVLMMLVAGLLDFFDGYIARKLGVSSDIGRELDSLADVVSFGVAPALLIYQRALTQTHWFGIIAVAFYVCCSAWRLARHNVLASTGRKPYFTGMPIEGGTVMLMSVVLASQNRLKESVMGINDTVIIAVAFISVLLAGILMVSTLRFTANVPWSIRLGALAVMVVGFLWPGWWIILIPFSYAAYGIVSNVIAWRQQCELQNLDTPRVPAPVGK